MRARRVSSYGSVTPTIAEIIKENLALSRRWWQRPVVLPPDGRRSTLMPVRSWSNLREALAATIVERDRVFAAADIERDRCRERRADHLELMARSREMVMKSRELLADIERLHPT